MKFLNSNARLAELANVGKSIVTFYNEVESLQSDEFLTTVVPEIDELQKTLTTALNQDKIKSELEEADAARDEAVRALGSRIEAYLTNPIEATQTAAQALQTVFDKYGKKIVALSYKEESTYIASLLEDLSAESLAESIAALNGMSDAISTLSSAQATFDELYAAYTNAKSAKADSAYSYRKPLLSAINDKLVTYLSAVVLVFSDKYSPFATNVETVITEVNTTVKKRSKSSSSETTESTETTE